jgi:hypothetical protein
MHTKRALGIVSVTLLAVACATTSPPPRTGFEDIPVPAGLAYHPGSSSVIESPSVKAGHLVYRGRLEPESLRVAMQRTLEASGWRHVGSAATTNRGTVQAYEKAGESLQVQIWEGLWYTYVALDVSRRLANAPVLTQGDESVRAPQGPLARGDGTVPSAGSGASLARPRGTWETIRDGTVNFGRSVGEFFSGLFSN